MPWLDHIAYFFGGVLFTNAIPHFVCGLMGRPFQTPFAKPPGVGLSSSVINVGWGFLNLVVAYLLLCRVGTFDLRDTADMLALGIGMLGFGLLTGQRFGRYNGGNTPLSTHH